MSDLRISIVVANYNKSSYLSETIQSVVDQSFNNWELIIIDDCSTDNSVRIIESFLLDKRIKFYKLDKNRGANYCRNLGLKNASGSYVMFLDADDILAPDCLEKRVDFISKIPECDFAVFPMGTFRNEIGDNPECWIPIKEKALERFLSHQLPWAICQPLWKKESLLKLNGFDESFQRLQDVELHTRALLEGFNFEVVSSDYSPDCFYRINERRINDTSMYLKKFSGGVLIYYNKFAHPVFKLNKGRYLFFCLVETLIYVLVFAKQNQADLKLIRSITYQYFKQKELSLVRRNVLKWISVLYLNSPFYPYGFKRLLRFLILDLKLLGSSVVQLLLIGSS